ncbi:lateral tail fiber protein [Escherichia phage DanielBernoulli]|uniref:Lateral tail fiber protein n=1 Tax=Escherichia phage DanielBernoulli TaxID=2851972 RepID=A0AAE7VQI1_9CAUD|nr:lateral tail fiber protein [Escherichia phage DanielBernoulli]
MALYRTGTAAMDAQGVITGTGTKWREPLSLIRAGATIVFLTSPLKLAVISDIVSDTEMKAIQTDGEPVENGNYVILLNDSLTVDGMAQDVAETLRYYQSKETVIEEAIEFFKNFDLKTIQDLVARAEASAQKTDADRAATEQLKNYTQTIKDAAVTETQQIKDTAVSETQQIKNAAVAETNQIKADTDAIKNQTQQIKDSAVTEITGIKNEALDARDEAENAQFAAEQSKVGADNAKAGAETARDEARQWAQQVQPENLLHKDQNLNDLANKDLAREALKVEAVNSVKDQDTGAYNSFRNPAWTYELRIANNGEWRVARNDNNSTSALSIGAGGTGAENVTQAKINLQVDRIIQDSVFTSMLSPDGLKEISVRNDGTWGMFNRYLKGWSALGIAQGGTGADNVAQARRNLGVGIDQDVTFNAVWAKAYYGQGGPWTAALIKEKSQQSSDGANLLTYVENSWFGVQNYVAGVPGQQYQYVWSFNTFGGSVVWYSMRNDNGFYTPEGRCAIQGSDVRIKDRFEPPKPGAWDRVKQIGVMEFYYKGNHVLQRGYLAQQMAEIDDTYVFFGGTATDENGDEFEIMNVNDRAVISDLIVVVQELQGKNEALESEVSSLKADIEQLKEMIAGLAGGNATTIPELP